MCSKPVILHTDIGSDIDDFWALVMLLRQSDKLELKMILTDTWNSVARAAICEKILEGTPFADRVLIGAGVLDNNRNYSHEQWVAGYDMSQYPGAFRKDGVTAMIELVRSTEEPMTLISIGPATSLAVALDRAPDIAGKLHLVGMFGSIRRKYDGSAGAEKEYNVKVDIPACRKLFDAQWLSFVNTPLDTCGRVVLSGENLRRILDSEDPLLRKLVECNQCFLRYQAGGREVSPPEQTTLLCDTVAVHLASSREFLKFQKLKLRVTDEGYTVEDPEHGRLVDTAVEWQDLAAFETYLTDTITNSSKRCADL